MAHYAVSELRGEDLSYRRLEKDEPVERPGAPGTLPELIGQCSDLVFLVDLEGELGVFAALVLPGLEVGLEDLVVELVIRVGHFGKKAYVQAFIKCSAGAHGEAVGPVVVVQRVDVAAVEVQVAGVGLAVRGVGPVVAVSTDIVQRTGVVGPVTRSASVGEWPVCWMRGRERCGADGQADCQGCEKCQPLLEYPAEVVPPLQGGPLNLMRLLQPVANDRTTVGAQLCCLKVCLVPSHSRVSSCLVRVFLAQRSSCTETRLSYRPRAL